MMNRGFIGEVIDL